MICVIKSIRHLRVKYFTDRSKAVLLLWILCVIYTSCLSFCLICSLQPCGHLLGKGLPLGSLVCDGSLCGLGCEYYPSIVILNSVY